MTTGKAMSLNDTGKTPTFGLADYVDYVTNLEDLRAKLLPNLKSVGTRDTEFPENAVSFDTALLKILPLRL